MVSGWQLTFSRNCVPKLQVPLSVLLLGRKLLSERCPRVILAHIRCVGGFLVFQDKSSSSIFNSLIKCMQLSLFLSGDEHFISQNTYDLFERCVETALLHHKLLLVFVLTIGVKRGRCQLRRDKLKVTQMQFIHIIIRFAFGSRLIRTGR